MPTFVCTVANRCGAKATHLGHDDDHGRWSTQPADVAVGTTTTFSMVSAGFMTGCEGTVSWEIEGRGRLQLRICNPFIGSPWMKVEACPPGVAVDADEPRGSSARCTVVVRAA